jgi:hypothetical protein
LNILVTVNGADNIVQYAFKGIVHRKLRGVEIGNNGQVLLYCWGTGHFYFYFYFFNGTILDFSKKRFAAT